MAKRKLLKTMKIPWVENQIADTLNWLELNEGQSFLPTMDMDDLLHKKEVAHKKQVLDILTKIRHH